MYSMTGYGRASLETEHGLLELEIHSVNRKGLDLSLFLPKGFLAWDLPIRKRLKESLERGQVTLRLSLQKNKKALLPKERLKSLKESLGKIASSLGYASDVVTFSLLLEKEEELEQEGGLAEDPTLFQSFEKLYEKAMKAFQSMRKKEGEHLKADLLTRLKTLEKALAKIEKRKHLFLEKYKEKILNKLKEFKDSMEEIQERLLREVALLADKLDITEEIVRLKSHFIKMEAYLKSQESLGRTLEFLIQEMGREINTIGSKSLEMGISENVVLMKGELEKMREQVQNLE